MIPPRRFPDLAIPTYRSFSDIACIRWLTALMPVESSSGTRPNVHSQLMLLRRGQRLSKSVSAIRKLGDDFVGFAPFDCAESNL